MNIKFTRSQELVLIDLGLKALLVHLNNEPDPVKKKSGAKWTPERHKKYAQTMKRKWAGKKTKS